MAPPLSPRVYHCGNFWFRVGLGASVLTGIEAALWDLKGKMDAVPVYEFLGGRKHDRLLGYTTGGPCNYPKEKLAEKIDYYLDLGFRKFKIAVGSYSTDAGGYIPETPAEAADFEGDTLRFIRSHAGKEIYVMLDGHMGNRTGRTWTLDVALAAAKELERDVHLSEYPPIRSGASVVTLFPPRLNLGGCATGITYSARQDIITLHRQSSKIQRSVDRPPATTYTAFDSRTGKNNGYIQKLKYKTHAA